MRCILVILDGLGDKGHAVFKGKTPLQAASTPNLDRLASLGLNGLYHSLLQGMAMPSELAHFLIFGYDMDEFPGRGVIEAVGEGIPVNEDDVALLARVFSVKLHNGKLILEEENPEADQETCHALHEEIRRYKKDGVELEFIPTKGVEGILILRGNVSADITDSNPLMNGRPLMEVLPIKKAMDKNSAIHTAAVLNSYLFWCFRKLSIHPMNQERQKKGLLPINALGHQRAGRKRNLLAFREKWGLRGLSVSSGSLYQGISVLLGMETYQVKDTGNPGEDLVERLKIAQEAEDFDFIHVHTKAPDAAAHKKDPQYKKAVIESLDFAFHYALEKILIDERILFVVTSDHSTASTGEMIHSGETVPLTMVGKYTRVDDVAAYNEISCAQGGLGLVRGKELMYLILNFLDRGKLRTLMDAPVDQPFFPGNYKSFRYDG